MLGITCGCDHRISPGLTCEDWDEKTDRVGGTWWTARAGRYRGSNRGEWLGRGRNCSYFLFIVKIRRLKRRKVRTEGGGWEHIGKRASSGFALGEINDWV